jgi:ribosomal protein S1
MKEEVKKPVKNISADMITAEGEGRKDGLMAKMFADSITPPSVSDIIEGTVIAIDRAGVFIDLPPFGTGIIYGREYIVARDVIKKISVGDKVSAKIVELRNADGYIEQ